MDPARTLGQMQVVCLISLQSENKCSAEKKSSCSGLEARKLAYDDVVKVCERCVIWGGVGVGDTYPVALNLTDFASPYIVHSHGMM